MNKKFSEVTDNVYMKHVRNIESISSEIDKDELFSEDIYNSVAYHFAMEPFTSIDFLFDASYTWLTVGDYNGYEANFLERKEQDVIASDVSDRLLKEAKERKFITKFSEQNVEHITYDDNSFDYVMCKQSFHHFSRAYLGLYEMIRVCKNATILLAEPVDILSRMATLLFIKNCLDRINPLLIDKIWKNRFSFEIVGNYVFKISEREIEKLSMGIGLPCIAFKRFNTIILENPPKSYYEVPLNKTLFKKIHNKLFIRNVISKIGILPYNTVCSIIFKQAPSEKNYQKFSSKRFYYN